MRSATGYYAHQGERLSTDDLVFMNDRTLLRRAAAERNLPMADKLVLLRASGDEPDEVTHRDLAELVDRKRSGQPCVDPAPDRVVHVEEHAEPGQRSPANTAAIVAAVEDGDYPTRQTYGWTNEEIARTSTGTRRYGLSGAEIERNADGTQRYGLSGT